jgi:hypothetical protein
MKNRGLLKVCFPSATNARPRWDFIFSQFKIPAFIRFMVILAFCMLCNVSWSQVGLRLSYMKHSGDYGYLMKPAIGYELLCATSEIDSRFPIGGGLGFNILETWQDTIYYAALQDDYSGHITFIPSYLTYDKCWTFWMTFNFGFKVLDRKLSPVAGAELNVNLISYNYERHVPGWLSEEGNDYTCSVGFLPYIGVSYNLNDFLLLNLGFGKNLSTDFKGSNFNYWKTYVSAFYYF